MLLNTSNKEWLQALTLRAIACATEVSNMLSFFYLEKIRDIIMNTSSKEWRQALQLRAISFFVLWSLSQSNSPTKGNIKLKTCRALQMSTMVLYCSFGLLACATEILPSWVLVSSYFYSLLVYENTSHANEHFKKMASSSPITRD